MRTLQVVGTEDGFVVVVSDTGERFHLPLNQALIDAVKRPSVARASSARRASPRDIQAHIRRGLSAQQVADLTGETVDYVSMFEGPVIAEREFVLEQARMVPMAGKTVDRDGTGSFGAGVRERLSQLAARDVEWSAWKEESGWMVEVSFTENQVEHKAVWSFDPRKLLLTPHNDDAVVLSQAEPIQGPLIPRLRPVAPSEDHTEDRFDSEIFHDMPLAETGPLLEPVPYGKTAVSPDDEAPDSLGNTADLLEALRRRRGERDPAPEPDESTRAAHPSTGSIRLVSDDNSGPGASVHQLRPATGEQELVDEEVDDPPAQHKPGSRKGRPEMPSWDDIVFGTKGEDDPA